VPRGLRAAVAVVVVLVAGVVLGGVATAEPSLSDAPVVGAPAVGAPVVGATESLLDTSPLPADPDGFAPDPGVPVLESTPCLVTVKACVELDTNQAWLVDNGRIVRGPVPIMHGDEETPTPRGTFTVQWKAEAYTSREYLVQMPWSVFFADGGIAFHEGNPDTYSAGCVKLSEEDAQAFFEYLKVGDAVQVV
jgi:hypothetical protein